MTSIAISPDEPMQLVAMNRLDLEAAHAKMTEWTRARLDKVAVDLDVEITNQRIAAENNWLTAPFDRRIATLKRQAIFYEKIIAALDAGFAIVPNFGMNLFAIRTASGVPRGGASANRWERFVQPAQLLRVGEGEYRNPEPEVYQRQIQKPDGKGGTTPDREYFPNEFTDLEFPLALAQPALMTSVGKAMALKLFDEIGVAADLGSRIGGGTRGDPIFLGRLLNPRKGRPALTFFIGWYFDPSRL